MSGHRQARRTCVHNFCTKQTCTCVAHTPRPFDPNRRFSRANCTCTLNNQQDVQR